jgi:hypothetical protein
MDILDREKITSSFLASEGWRFRYFDRRWMVLDGGYWHSFQAQQRLYVAITAHTRETWTGDAKVLEQVGQIGPLNKICAMLVPKLFVDRLPARREEPTEPS